MGTRAPTTWLSQISEGARGGLVRCTGPRLAKGLIPERKDVLSMATQACFLKFPPSDIPVPSCSANSNPVATLKHLDGYKNEVINDHHEFLKLSSGVLRQSFPISEPPLPSVPFVWSVSL